MRGGWTFALGLLGWQALRSAARALGHARSIEERLEDRVARLEAGAAGLAREQREIRARLDPLLDDGR